MGARAGTFGVTQEDGISFAPDGRSFVTSIGIGQSTVWIHDARGDRQVSSEGYGFRPSISPDGKKVYYLLRTFGKQSWISGGLWVADLESGQRQRLLPDMEMLHYSISADGERVAFVSVEDGGRTPVWLAPLNGRTAPRRLGTFDGSMAHFGAPASRRRTIDKAPFIYRVNEDGSGLQKKISKRSSFRSRSSPTDAGSGDGRPMRGPRSTCIRPAAASRPGLRHVLAAQGTDPMPSAMSWTPDGRFVYLRFADESREVRRMRSR